jgi:hypothetical protein
MTWGSNEDRTPHQIRLDEILAKRRWTQRIRVLLGAGIVLLAAIAVGLAGYSLAWLPEIIGHIAGRIVHAYNDAVR